MASSQEPRGFFSRIPSRSLSTFMLAVFFTFAPVSYLLVSSFEQTRPAVNVLSYMAVSGALAVCWAAAFTISRWFIVGIVALTVTLIAMSGPLRGSRWGIGDARASWEAVLIMLAIVAGYTLFVRFISGQGRTTVRLMTEMSLARQIHDTLVPPIEMSRRGQFDALGVSTPSSEVGGDLIDVVQHEKFTDFFVVDVSGHGVRAGVVMAMVKAAVRSRSLGAGDLAKTIGEVNTVLEATTSPELYATLAGVRIDHRQGHAECVLAGHHHVAVFREHSGTVERLIRPGFPVGMMQSSRYEKIEISLRPRDLLAIYTDGLNETANHDDEELGHDEIERVLNERAGEPLRSVQQALLALVSAHGEQVDDRSLLLIRIADQPSLSTRIEKRRPRA